MPGSSSVVGADASTPAKVIAVVAAVSPNDGEPPTMSNPGQEKSLVTAAIYLQIAMAFIPDGNLERTCIHRLQS